MVLALQRGLGLMADAGGLTLARRLEAATQLTHGAVWAMGQGGHQQALVRVRVRVLGVRV